MQPHPAEGSEANPDRQGDAAIYFGTAVGTILLARLAFVTPDAQKGERACGLSLISVRDESPLYAELSRDRNPDYDRPHDRLVLRHNPEGDTATQSTYTLAPYGVVLRRDTEIDVTINAPLRPESDPVGVGWTEIKSLNNLVANMQPLIKQH